MEALIALPTPVLTPGSGGVLRLTPPAFVDVDPSFLGVTHSSGAIMVSSDFSVLSLDEIPISSVEAFRGSACDVNKYMEVWDL